MNNPIIVRLIEALPLPTFLIYAAIIDQSISQNWLGPYALSSGTALLTTIYLLRNNVLLNRLFVGINIYLITGSVGLLTNLAWLNQLYGTLEASGMLAWIIILGVASLSFSPAGFIGVTSQDRGKIVKFSLYLLLVAVIAFLVSFFLQGNKLFSEYIPFITVFAAHNILKARMEQRNT